MKSDFVVSDHKPAERGLFCVHHYSVILLDMHMPSLDGLEIMRHLHSKRTEHCVPVIAISGDQRYRTVAIAAGACAFLFKPFKHGELETKIYSALSGADLRAVGDIC